MIIGPIVCTMGWGLPRAGVSVEHALGRLRELEVSLRNAGSSSSESLTRADQLVRWTESAERSLRSDFADEEVWSGLYSERYWRIRDLVATSTRPAALVTDEIEWQAHRLAEIGSSLSRLHSRLTVPKDCKQIVLDTNVLLHCNLFTDIPWQRLAGGRQARIILPLVVIDELDKLKQGAGRDGKRAGVVIRHLRTLATTSPTSEEVFPVRENVTWQYLEEPPKYVRRASNDDEIVRQCTYIEAVSGEVLLFTRDFGMQIRCRVAGIRSEVVPQEFALDRQGASSKEDAHD